MTTRITAATRPADPMKQSSATRIANMTENPAVIPTTPCGTPSGSRSRSSVAPIAASSRIGEWTSSTWLPGCASSLIDHAPADQRPIDREQHHGAADRREQPRTFSHGVPTRRATDDTRDHRACDTQQGGDERTAGIPTRHQELCDHTYDEADDQNCDDVHGDLLLVIEASAQVVVCVAHPLDEREPRDARAAGKAWSAPCHDLGFRCRRRIEVQRSTCVGGGFGDLASRDEI